MSTKEELYQEGEHIDALRQITASIGLAMLQIAGEVAVHCSEEEGRAIADFAGTVLRPIVQNLADQTEVLAQQYKAADGEVNDLEQMFSAPEAVKPPAPHGYL